MIALTFELSTIVGLDQILKISSVYFHPGYTQHTSAQGHTAPTIDQNRRPLFSKFKKYPGPYFDTDCLTRTRLKKRINVKLINLFFYLCCCTSCLYFVQFYAQVMTESWLCVNSGSDPATVYRRSVERHEQSSQL